VTDIHQPRNGQTTTNSSTRQELRATSPALEKGALREQVTRADISMSREILTACLPALSAIVQPLTRLAKQLGSGELAEAPRREWYQALLTCCDQLTINLSQDAARIQEPSQLDSLRTELQSLASDSRQLTTELRQAVCLVRDAYERHLREHAATTSTLHDSYDAEYDEHASEAQALQDSSQEFSENDHEARAQEDSIQRQCREWIDDLDEIHNRIELACPVPLVHTVADLLTRLSCPQVATTACEESERIGFYAKESISAIHLVLQCMRDAWGDIRALPRMTAKQTAAAFETSYGSNRAAKGHWEHIQNVLAPQMPIELTARPGRTVQMRMYAPDTTLTYCTKAWARLREDLESLRPLLTHVGAELYIDSRCKDDTVTFSCEVRLPGNATLAAKLDRTTLRLMKRDALTLRGESLHQKDRVTSFIITDEVGDAELRVFATASGLLHPANRERLGEFLPGLSHIAAELGVQHVLAMPELSAQGNDASSIEFDEENDPYHTGDYAISMFAQYQAPPQDRHSSARAELKETRAYLRRWLAVGEDADRVSSPPPSWDTRIALPLSFLAQPDAMDLLEDLARQSAIKGLDFCSFSLSPEECGPALRASSDLVTQLHKHLNISEETRIVCINLSPFSNGDAHVRIVIMDSRDAVWATADFTPGELQCSLKEYPHFKLGELGVGLHEIMKELMHSNRRHVTVAKLHEALLVRGFEVCDDLLLTVCKAQYQREEPLSADELARVFLRYLAFSPATYNIEVQAVEEPGLSLKIIDRDHKTVQGL
jgi:hypothetical protein